MASFSATGYQIFFAHAVLTGVPLNDSAPLSASLEGEKYTGAEMEDVCNCIQLTAHFHIFSH
jgi:hypothetical protein